MVVSQKITLGQSYVTNLNANIGLVEVFLMILSVFDRPL